MQEKKTKREKEISKENKQKRQEGITKREREISKENKLEGKVQGKTSRLLNRADCERKIEKKKLAEISISLIVGKYGILL